MFTNAQVSFVFRIQKVAYPLIVDLRRGEWYETVDDDERVGIWSEGLK